MGLRPLRLDYVGTRRVPEESSIEQRRKTDDEGEEGVNFGENFDDVIFEQPLIIICCESKSTIFLN